MADRYPLIYNPSANQIQELQSGDSLDVGNGLVKNATGYATSTGTSSQFLKADGSSDSNTYLTSAGTIALAQNLTGTPNITVGTVSGTTGTFSGNVSAVNVSASSSVTAATFYGNVSAVNVSASSSVTAATFYGDGQNLTNTGSTLSASSGTQRVVLTGQTSGTMTASSTDSDFTYDSSTSTLNVQNLNVQGTTTTIDTAITEVDSLNVEGNVGIGTDNPQNKLDVRGDIRIQDSIPTILFRSPDGSSNQYYIGANISDSVDGGFIIGEGSSINGGTERIRINHLGNIGINSTTPSGRLDVGGNILPDADNTRDLGSASKRWANIYTGDLNLSNEGAVNDVDGTWGQYTIQEGENDLFLINRRTGKKYKFNLTEVN